MYIFLGATALLSFSFSFNLAHGHDSIFDISSSSSGAEVNVRFGEETLERLEDNGLEKRQACGAGVGSCPSGQCCSSAGQCGTGIFCNGPDCQLAYGPGCDGNKVPPGDSTLNIPRTKAGSLAYGGAGFYHCTTLGNIALTFDDGPYNYTSSILDTLQKYNVHATFFINGNSLGKGRIDDPSTLWPGILNRMYNAGHQLASHTYTHQDLTQLPQHLMQNQVIYNEMAFRNIFGFFPTYIRPPFGYCSGSSTCSDFLNSMGYHIIYWDIDTKDYLNDSPSLIQNSKNYFSGNLSNPAGTHSYMSLSHDIHNQTAVTLVSYMLDTLNARGYKAVTVGECLGDPRANWYRNASTSTSSSSSTVASTSASTGSSTSSGSTGGKSSNTGATHTGAAITALAAVPTISPTTVSTSSTTSAAATSATTTSAKSEGNFLRASSLSWILVLGSLTFGPR